jgi:HAD superfamily hydrolase (TIGR01549 family)
MIEAVIFDVDGTLVDSVDLHAESWTAALEKFGKPVPFADVRRQIGKGADQLMPMFLSQSELAEFGRELDEYRSGLFKREYLPRVKGFPKVRELVQRLRLDGKKVVLASSAKADELDSYKRIARVDDIIETETSSDDAERSKPYPDIFQAALAELPRIAVQNIVVVGDTPYDAEAAAKARLRTTIGLLCGGWSEAELREAGCVKVYRDPADLLAHYKESPLSAQAFDHF